MDKSTYGDVSQRQAVAHFGSGIGTTHYLLTHFKAIGGDHVCLFTIGIIEEGDAGGAIGIILNALHRSDHAVLRTLEVDQAELALVATAAIAVGEVAGSVAAAGGTLADGQGFLRCGSSDGSFEHTYNFVSLTRSDGFEFSYCHCVYYILL